MVTYINMPCPQTYEELLASPCLVINREVQPDRLERTTRRLKRAGFSNITRIPAVDNPAEFEREWAKHGSPAFAEHDALFVDVERCPSKQGTLLSDLRTWKYIIDNELPWAVVYEDDVKFHKDWATLAPQYFNATTKDYGLCYMGFYCEPYIPVMGPVIAPLFCFHAVIVTLEGAKKLYDMVTKSPVGVYTNDCMIFQAMVNYVHGNKDALCKWYMWNAHMFPDSTCRKIPQYAQNDIGLVFQEYFS